jgi:hypothetical protein
VLDTDAYIPSDWQTRFHCLDTFEALGAGSAGPGKSLCLLMDPLKNVMEEHERCRDRLHPHHIPMGRSMGHTLHLRRTYKMLSETIDRSKLYFPRVDPDADWNESNLTWTFKSGYKYEFGHCQNPDDWTAYQSRQFDVICFDELTQFEKKQYDGLRSRCRSGDPFWIGRERVRSMSNPMPRQEGGERLVLTNPHWVRDRFVKPYPEGGKILRRRIKMADGTYEIKTRIYLPAKLCDNPNAEFRRTYEATLRDLPEHLMQIMLEGNWWYQIGAYFGSVWNPRMHCIKPFAIPASWRIFRMMDWGYRTQGVILWGALTDEKELFIFREFNFKEMDDKDVAKRVIEIEKSLGLISKNEHRSRLTGPADTQIWEQRGDSAKTKAATFLENGVSWVPADKGRYHNAEMVYGRLKDHGQGTKDPGLVFFTNCQKCIQTMPALQADPHDPSVPQKGGDDHWYDAISYGVAYASTGLVGKSADDIEEERDRPRSSYQEQPRGQYGYG